MSRLLYLAVACVGLEGVRRRITSGVRDYQLVDLSGGIQVAEPPVNSAADPARDSAIHSTIGLIGIDRPKPVPSVDGMILEIAVDPSITNHVSGVEDVSAKRDSAVLAALEGVNYGKRQGRSYRQQQTQLLKHDPVEPIGTSMAPAQVSLNDQEGRPGLENNRDQGPAQRLEMGKVHAETQGEGGNQHQGRSHELNLLGRPESMRTQHYQGYNQEGVVWQRQQWQQQLQHKKGQQQQEERQTALTDVQAQLKALIEDTQDQQDGQKQTQEPKQQQVPPRTYYNAQQQEGLPFPPSHGHPENADKHAGVAAPSSAETVPFAPLYDFLRGVAAVWSRRLEASSSDGACSKPPCRQVRPKHCVLCRLRPCLFSFDMAWSPSLSPYIAACAVHAITG